MTNPPRYACQVGWSVEDDAWVATVVEFASVSWLNAGPCGALGGIIDLVADVIMEMTASGELIPEPIDRSR